MTGNRRVLRLHLHELRVHHGEDAAGVPTLVLETRDVRVELHPGADGLTHETARPVEALAAHAREYALAVHLAARAHRSIRDRGGSA